MDVYRHGDADVAVAEFAGWSRKDLDAARPPDGTPTTAAAAAGLELEALVRATEAQQRAWPDRPSTVPAVLALVDEAQKAGDRGLVQFSHDWILAFEAYAARFDGPPRDDGDAIRRADWPDPPLLLVRGAIAEQHMGPLLRLGRPGTADSGDRLALRRGDFDRGLSYDAETLTRQAATADPALVDAPLHLGRVIFLLGRDAEAQPILEQALQTARARGAVNASSLAALFLGQLHEENGRPAQAREMYQLAVSLDPHAASARLGLGTNQLVARRRDLHRRVGPVRRLVAPGQRRPASDEPRDEPRSIVHDPRARSRVAEVRVRRRLRVRPEPAGVGVGQETRAEVGVQVRKSEVGSQKSEVRSLECAGDCLLYPN